MNAKSAAINAKPFIYIAAVAACAMLSATLQAYEVTVKVPVSAVGLDLTQPAGARELYRRLREASRLACSNHYQVALVAVDNAAECYERALGNAIRSANQLELTTVYLRTHTRGEAATHGIEVPPSVAAK